MKSTLLKKVFITGVLACGSLLSASSWSQTTSFSDSYKGAKSSGSSTCGTAYSISGVEPSAAGQYPVFIYTVGTFESHDNASAMAAINSMAAKGYIAAAVGYGSSQFGDCTAIKNKTSCIYNPNNNASAISKLCSRPNADCSKGVVVAGFSQGGIVAINAKNYDARVQAAYSTGASTKYDRYDMSSCMADGNRTLQSDRLRAVNGEKDNYGGGTHASNQAELEKITGKTCAAGSAACMNSNDSGWIIVKNSQVQDGSADHCYMRASGDCFGSQNSLDSGWKSGTANWQLEQNLNWLKGFTTP
jgi:dienelactone hydrolase